MRLTASLLALAALVTAGASFAEDKHKHHEAHAGHMLESYGKIAQALFKDNLETAKTEAGKMAEHDEESACAPHAKAISTANDLTEARTHFKALSAEAIKMASTREGFVVMHCPMVKGGGGDWLQTAAHAEHVMNPYFGAKMPHCGGLKKPKAE